MNINKVLKLVLSDYEKGLLYREDSLKISFYHHLRKLIEKDDNKYLYAELNLIDSIGINYKSDIAISNKLKTNNNKNIPIKEIYEMKFSKSSLKSPLEMDIKKFEEINKINKKIKLNFFMIYESKSKIEKIKENICKILKDKVQNGYNIYFLIVKLNKNENIENKFLFKYNGSQLNEL